MTTSARSAPVALVVAVSLLALGCATASASEISRVSSVPISNELSLIVSDGKGDAPGEVNEVKVGLAPEFPNDYRITDTGGIQGQIPPGCLRESGNSVRCPTTVNDPEPTPVSRIFVRLGGENDEFSPLDPAGIPEDVLLEVWGGPGDDTIFGRKGGGREILIGDSQNENGGPQGPFGNDTLVTGAPEDGKELDGGGGDDVIVIIVNNHARSFLAATGLAFTAKVSPFGLLLGGAGNDKVSGGPRKDKIKGGSGRDRLKGRGGNDIIDCGPGKGDLGVGGPGRDLGRNCEKVKH